MNRSSAILVIILSAVLYGACESDTSRDSAPHAEPPARIHGFQQPESGTVPAQSPALTERVNFVSAAKAVTPGVVHIKTSYNSASGSGDPFEQLFGRSTPRSQPVGSGSGVIIGSDGYIATNNHVIENAETITVIFPDRREFIAELVGSDPNTDLALLKVKAADLPVVKFGNSDNVEVGEGVLAVGYPYSLNTTVTAGIVSAKGRSIGIINQPGREAYPGTTSRQTSSAIESFIQTDAAINPGNSGGALVNVNGELIGINTAIASLTGSYAGYAFAIPVNLAKKILEDLKAFGTVKRGILGVAFPSPSAEDQYFRQLGLSPGSVKGVFITDIQKGSAAASAGLEEGDIIQSIDGVQLFSSAEFSERVARHRPGDKITLTYLRDGKTDSTSVILKGEEELKSLTDSGSLKEIYNKLGATFAPLSPELKQRFNINSGVVVTEVRDGGFFDRLGIPPGVIITYINGRTVNNPKDIDDALIKAKNKTVQILGIAPDGSRVAFNFSLGA
ncbi:trypsin-like peptidase domain-containing protein [Agriterribacter sp.]|uniref:trypsin-like peptidase domain-containing protein n=1 Tax=Agriterribacter sp. TaxID=2821509 RepID=UPI002CC3D22F|nr:trypsin-like peptidase domain-containing protein [Agriterribacter sp.]HRO47510.1 trypsin-like peptidase domain-containing protein [Agriterribacter sp.]HRQ18324.1 trypsin-like peptidase domain-containing protein [Agriterribacter sp.]